jgi:acyl-CoA hydrolase
MIPSHRIGRAVAGLCLALLLAACGGEGVRQALPAGATVLAFGDSVTFGLGAGPGQDYPAQLAELTRWRVINAGISGDTAREARQRLAPLLKTHRPDLVIVELGGNDFLRKRPEREVKADLHAIIRESQASGAIAVLVAVPRLSMLRASIGALSDASIFAELAEETGATLVADTFSGVLSDDSLRADRIHPNALGYRVLAEGIAQRLRAEGLLP